MLEQIKFWEKNEDELDKQIEKRIKGLEDSYGKTDLDGDRISNIKDLVDIRESLKGRKTRIDPNTVISAAVSVGSIILIIIYENRHVFATAAKNFIPKVRM